VGRSGNGGSICNTCGCGDKGGGGAIAGGSGDDDDADEERGCAESGRTGSCEGEEVEMNGLADNGRCRRMRVEEWLAVPSQGHRACKLNYFSHSLDRKTKITL
jgi:hypothetical protein